MVTEFVYRDHSRNDAYALHLQVKPDNFRDNVLKFAKSSIAVVFGG